MEQQITTTKLALIYGITGQDGSYLAELLLSKNYKVYGNVRRTSLYYKNRVDHLRHKINLEYCDITDGISINNFIRTIIKENPDFSVLEIYNLSAQSHVGLSFNMPEYTSDVDGLGVLKILDCIKHLPDHERNKVKFYQAGTSELFGKVLETPQTETTPFNPVSPYACAKAYAYYMTKIYREGYNMYCVNGILFNHESPRRGENFVTMKVVNGVKDIIDTNTTTQYIELGNLDSKRDWGHAKDYVYGMWLMMQQDTETPKDYVLATNSTHSVRSFVEKCFAYKKLYISWSGEGLNEVGIDQYGITRIKINPRYYRPCEVDLLLGDSSKAETELNWSRKYQTLDELITSMFDEYHH